MFSKRFHSCFPKQSIYVFQNVPLYPQISKIKRFQKVGLTTVLILVVLIGLVIIFKKQITSLLDSIFSEINKQSKEVY